jgi:hypothetical protein
VQQSGRFFNWSTAVHLQKPPGGTLTVSLAPALRRSGRHTLTLNEPSQAIVDSICRRFVFDASRDRPYDTLHERHIPKGGFVELCRQTYGPLTVIAIDGTPCAPVQVDAGKYWLSARLPGKVVEVGHPPISEFARIARGCRRGAPV